MNLGQILDQALSLQNTTYLTADSMTVQWGIGVVNELQDRAFTQAEPSWAVRQFKFQTAPSYTSGWINVATQGRTAVQGNAQAGWDGTFVGRKLRIGTGPEWYEIHEVDTTDPTGPVLQIEPPYIGTTLAATSTYAIYQDEYPLPGDFRAMISARDETRPTFLRYEDPWTLDHGIPRLFWASPTSGQALERYTITKRSRRPLLFSTAGTITLTQFSDRVTLVDSVTPGISVDDARYRSCYARMSGSTTFVQFRAITATTAAGGLTTTTAIAFEPWRGATVSVRGYELVPKGEYRIGFYPVPDSRRMVECRYYHQADPLVSFEDVPVLPREHHDYLWLGLAYRLAELSSSEVAQAQMEALNRSFAQAEARMLRAMSPNRDRVYQRRRFGLGGWNGYDGPTYPGNYPREWSRPRDWE